MFTYNKLVIELVGEERVGQLSEVHFEQRADRVNVIDVDFLLDLLESLLVESVSQLLDVGLETSMSVDAVHDAILFDKLGANR